MFIASNDMLCSSLLFFETVKGLMDIQSKFHLVLLSGKQSLKWDKKITDRFSFESNTHTTVKTIQSITYTLTLAQASFTFKNLQCIVIKHAFQMEWEKFKFSSKPYAKGVFFQESKNNMKFSRMCATQHTSFVEHKYAFWYTFYLTCCTCSLAH